jgi:hypothetical protein
MSREMIDVDLVTNFDTIRLCRSDSNTLYAEICPRN